ncbi:MAG: transaldolase family protein, partial [Gaiellales bacterium]
MAESNLHAAHELGQSIWIDFLSRDLVQSGGLARMIQDDAVTGVTSNPTIFQAALAEGSLYDEQLTQVANDGDPSDKEIFIALGSTDVAAACDVLRGAYDAADGADGYVSFEVDPTLAYDVEQTIAEAFRLHDLIDRPNLYVKIPATLPGLAAIEEMIASGKSINVTLIFSLERYAGVAEAYMRGLERLV